jgi:hypothetical protein
MWGAYFRSYLGGTRPEDEWRRRIQTPEYANDRQTFFLPRVEARAKTKSQ